MERNSLEGWNKDELVPERWEEKSRPNKRNSSWAKAHHIIRLTWWWLLWHGHVQLPVEQDCLCLPMMLAEVATWIVQSYILWFSDSAECCKSNWTALCRHNEKWPKASCKSNPRVSRGKAKGYSSMASQSPDLNPAEHSSYWRKTAQINRNWVQLWWGQDCALAAMDSCFWPFTVMVLHLGAIKNKNCGYFSSPQVLELWCFNTHKQKSADCSK